jgi:hypothetical protein
MAALPRYRAVAGALVVGAVVALAGCQSAPPSPSETPTAPASSAHAEDEVLDGGTKLRFVTFDDLAPEGYLLKESWDSMGIDDQGRVYIGWTSLRPDGKEDYAVFRYDEATGERKFLGTLMQASEAAGNLDPGEQIPKGHTRLIFAEGKIYVGSQSFHDFKDGLDGLEDMRGSHIYAYDIERDVLEDLSADLPGGVVTPQQGIVAMTYQPEERLLVGLTHPMSDLVLFDLADNTVRDVVEGIPWSNGNPVSREIVATKYGKVYLYRGTESPEDRALSFPMYEYDLASGAVSVTDQWFDNGFWNGQAPTADGEQVYISTVNGGLFVLNAADGSVRSLTLSEDERQVYGIPTGPHGGLYAYDVERADVTRIATLPDARYTGNNIRDDEGNLYFARFGNARDWSFDGRLMILTPPSGD